MKNAQSANVNEHHKTKQKNTFTHLQIKIGHQLERQQEIQKWQKSLKSVILLIHWFKMHNVHAVCL